MALPQHAQDYMAVLSVATNAVSTTASVAQMAMGSFAVAFAILGIIGFIAIRRTVTWHAGKTLKTHLDSEHFKNKIDSAIIDAVQARFSRSVILHSGGNGGDGDIGPRPPGGT
jgi:hypothetical protein